MTPSWRKSTICFLWILSTVVVIQLLCSSKIFDQAYNFKVEKFIFGEQIQNADGMISHKNSQPIRIMILSSMKRSGSTLLGEILQTKDEDNGIYYFEPDHHIHRNRCLLNDSCTVQFFKDIYSCNLPTNFQRWLKEHKLYVKYYNQDVKFCFENKTEIKDCLEKIDWIHSCKVSSYQLVKNVEVRLKLAEQLLKDDRLNLKIVHLSRDPRGSFVSMLKQKWKISVEKKCTGLLEDLIKYKDLKEKFPNRVTKLTYESFCLNPWEETRKLFGFLFNDPVLSETTTEYLQNHLASSQKRKGPGVLNTYKDPEDHLEGWRQTITKKILKTIENDEWCRQSIERMGHRLFESEQNVRNLSLNLFL